MKPGGKKQIPVAHNVQGVALPASSASLQNQTNRLYINHLSDKPPMAPWMQFPVCPPVRGRDRSATLTTLFETAAAPTAPPIDAPVARKKHGWLPLLTVLFLISYGLMTMLIVEQGSTIESQRALIRELYRDSDELTAHENEGSAGKERCRRAAPGPDSGGENTSSSDPVPVVPVPVNPGTHQAGPVFPGGTTTPCAVGKKRNRSSRCRRGQCPIESMTHALSSRCNARLRKRSQNTTKPERQFCG